MIIKNISEVRSFIAGDKTIIKEILHPLNDAVDIPYSLAHATVEVGQQSLAHQLKSSELYYILEGTGEVHINDEVSVISENELVLIPAMTTQWIKNIGQKPLKFLCIVHPFWKKEDEIV